MNDMDQFVQLANIVIGATEVDLRKFVNSIVTYFKNNKLLLKPLSSYIKECDISGITSTYIGADEMCQDIFNTLGCKSSPDELIITSEAVRFAAKWDMFRMCTEVSDKLRLFTYSITVKDPQAYVLHNFGFVSALCFITVINSMANKNKVKSSTKVVQVSDTRELERLKGRVEELSKANTKIYAETKAPLEKTIEFLRAENEELRAELAMYQSVEEINKVIEEAGVELLELPTTGVVVVGGHPRLIGHMSEVYPDWKYISADSLNCDFGSSDCVFRMVGYMGHKMSKRVSTYVDDNSVIDIYTGGSNLDRIFNEMQLKYTEKKLVKDENT